MSNPLLPANGTAAHPHRALDSDARRGPLLPANEIVSRPHSAVESQARRTEARQQRRLPFVLLESRIPLAVSLFGYREERDQPLQDADLWVDGIAPRDQYPRRAHHMCGICRMVKSHPVSYACGHSHCYVCIRLWLEEEWSCPDCRKIMYRAPERLVVEEAWLADAYPDWVDESVVRYRWDGLRFPSEPKVLVPATP